MCDERTGRASRKMSLAQLLITLAIDEEKIPSDFGQVSCD